MGLWLGWFPNCPSKKKNQEKKLLLSYYYNIKKRNIILKKEKKFILLPILKKEKKVKKLWTLKKIHHCYHPLSFLKMGKNTIHKKKKVKVIIAEKHNTHFVMLEKKLLWLFLNVWFFLLFQKQKNYRSTWNDIALSKGLKIAPFTLLKKHYNNSSSTPKLFAMLNEIR